VVLVVGCFLILGIFSYVSMQVKPGDTWYDLGGKPIRDSLFESTSALNKYFTTTDTGKKWISAFMIFCGL
jgi:hypothetical protein